MMRDYCKSSKAKGMIAAVITLAELVFSAVAAVLVIYNTLSYTSASSISYFDIWVFSLIFAGLSGIPVTLLTVIGMIHGTEAVKEEGKRGKAALALNIVVLCISHLLGCALLFTHIIVIGMSF